MNHPHLSYEIFHAEVIYLLDPFNFIYAVSTSNYRTNTKNRAFFYCCGKSSPHDLVMMIAFKCLVFSFFYIIIYMYT